MGNISEHQYMQKTSMHAKVYKPRVKVSFHTPAKCYHVQADEKNKYGEKLDPAYQLLSVNTQKSLSSPAGAFTISLAGTQWTAYLKPNDIVVIQMGYAGEKTLTTAMVGFIDNVRRTRSMGGDGTPIVSCTVTGRDFGKVLNKSMLKFYPEIGMADGAKEQKFFLTDEGWLELMKFFTADQITTGTPAVVLDNIMRGILLRLNDVKWKVYDEHGTEPKAKEVTLGNVLRYQLAKIDVFLPLLLTADQFEGAVWNLMERCSIKPFTELWVDVRSSEEAWNPSPKNRAVPDTVEQSSSPNKASADPPYPAPAFQFGEDGAKILLCLRETPFDSKHKDILMRHEIHQDDVSNEDLSINDNEHYNLFWAGTTINPLGIDLKRVAPPLFNEKDAKKFGLSPLEVQVEGLNIERSKEDEHKVLLEDMTKAYTAKLKAWFEKNHEYWNGTLTVRGDANVRIGHMINYRAPSFEKEFYVEGVSHTFNVFDDWKMTLQVTRGQKIDEKVDHTVYIPKPPEPPKPPEAKPPEPKDSYYTVKRGDTLWAIAGRHYNGKNTDWRKIWEANKDMLIKRDKRNANDHGHWIFPGQRLRIPK